MDSQDNAIGYGCWNVAGLLARRGAWVDKLWHAAEPGTERDDLITWLRGRHQAP